MTKEMQYLKSNIELQELSLRCIDRFNNKEIDIYDVVATITLVAFKKGLKASIYDWGE
jgi:hypothetical protein